MLVPYLSLDRTRSLIDECLRSYLLSSLDHEPRNTPEPRHQQANGEANASLTLPHPFRSDLDNAKTGTAPQPIPSPSRAPPPPPSLQMSSPKATNNASDDNRQHTHEPSRYMFRQFENYIIACFSSVECLNIAFLAHKPSQFHRAASEGTVIEKCLTQRSENWLTSETTFPELDAKMLLLGDFAENGTWWTGQSQVKQDRPRSNAGQLPDGGSEERVNVKTPRINWAELNEWYRSVFSIERSWRDILKQLQDGNLLDEKQTSSFRNVSTDVLRRMNDEITDACLHVQRTLFKAAESLLRRPGRPVKSPEDCRFLLILLANPLLYTSEPGKPTYSNSVKSERSASQGQTSTPRPPIASLHPNPESARRSPSTRSSSAGKHSGVIKRILGLLANASSECHLYLVNWFGRFSESHFRSLVDLIGNFVTYRLSKQHGRNCSNSHDPSGGLIPSISGPGAGTSAHLHAALSFSAVPKPPDKTNIGVSYAEDWQIKAAAKVMSLLFSANIQGSSRVQDVSKSSLSGAGRTRAGSAARQRANRHGQLLPTSAFYNTLLDLQDLVADFEGWESRRGKFSFCQYPMFLSIWAKIRIMEHDARRQMEIKAREAFFNSIMDRKAISQFLVLQVRRDCLVEDSLRGVSEVVGTGQEEIKKGLKIEFKGEEGLDSGGLRKEWFLLLVREVFDPEHGLFVYDEESRYCYFNPNTFETSDQFFLVGVLLGLAIYNSTILDVALPPFTFRKLLASAPNYTGPATSSLRPAPGHTLEDLAELHPSLAHGLKEMLEFDGNVDETFCRDFVADVERYGQIVQVPLCTNGKKRSVNNSNRHEFVELYVRYLLDTSIARQYEPFKRGFFTVCGGNALSLFRPEEIELLVRGSDEPLDVATLRTVAIYDGWGKGNAGANESVVTWFWEAFARASAKDQRKLLSFITASDRIPATGATSLVIKIVCLGDHSTRLPIARTCFNMLALYRYQNREILEDKLWTAVVESEGFGMK